MTSQTRYRPCSVEVECPRVRDGSATGFGRAGCYLREGSLAFISICTKNWVFGKSQAYIHTCHKLCSWWQMCWYICWARSPIMYITTFIKLVLDFLHDNCFYMNSPAHKDNIPEPQRKWWFNLQSSDLHSPSAFMMTQSPRAKFGWPSAQLAKLSLPYASQQTSNVQPLIFFSTVFWL